MDEQQFFWTTDDGVKMFGRYWYNATITSPLAVIVLVHGMNEHSGRYEKVAATFVEAGYAVVAYDQRGHGLTQGKRGDTPSYDQLLDGVEDIVKHAQQRHPHLPMFLYGHSMGGNVTLNYVLRRQSQFVGVIASSPWLELAFKPALLDVILGRIMEFIYPSFTIRRPLNVKNLTRDEPLAADIQQDHLRHHDITARFFFGVERAGQYALQHADELKLPLLLMHGNDDQVTSLHASERFAKRAGQLCKFMMWPGRKHEIHNDIGRDEVLTAVLEWLNHQLEKKSN